MHEVLGQSPTAGGVRQQRTGLGQRRAPRVGIEMSGREDQRTQWLQPLLDGELRSAFSMTEPNTAGSDPTLLSTRAVLDGEEYVINGTSGTRATGRSPISSWSWPSPTPTSTLPGLVDVHRPVDTPGSTSCVTCPPWRTRHLLREVRQPCRDPLHRRPGSAANLVGNEGAGFQLAQARLGPGRIHHCMRCSASRGGPSTCCVSGPCRATPRLDAGGEADRAELGGGLARRDACGEAHDAAGGMEDDQVGAAEARVEIAMIKYYGRASSTTSSTAPSRSTARSGTRATCPWSRCTAPRAPLGSMTGPTRCTARRGPATLRNYKPTEVPTEHIPTARSRPRRSSPRCSRRSPSPAEPGGGLPLS